MIEQQSIRSGLGPAVTRHLPLFVGIAIAGVLLSGCAMQPDGMGHPGPGGGMPGHMSGGSAASDIDNPPPVADAVEVVVAATDFGFEPAMITMTVGETRNFTVVNQGAALHDFAIPDLGLRIAVAPGEEASTAFTASTAGTFPILCTYPGHAQLGMVGELRVKVP